MRRPVWLAIALFAANPLPAYAAPAKARRHASAPPRPSRAPRRASAARPTVHLSATLTPEQLGRPTTIGLSLAITGPGGRTPPPLKRIDLRYPEVGIALSGLGTEICAAAALEAKGPSGCPPDSVMGHGSALGEIPFGPELIREGATVTIARAEDRGGQIALLVDAEGISPVKANVVLPALLEEARPPYGGRLGIAVPPIASLPEAPNVSIGSLSATLGPRGLTYYQRKGGEAVPYRPKGILLPDRCPRGGFPFAATLAFYGGARVKAHAVVRCPPRRRRAARRRGRRSHRSRHATIRAIMGSVVGSSAQALGATRRGRR